MEISHFAIENTLLRKGGNSDSYFKNETNEVSTYLIFMTKKKKKLLSKRMKLKKK